MANRIASDDYDLEFRCSNDDAWYNVGVVLHGETLTVKYQNFADEKYNSGDFITDEAVDDFCKRFRPISEQLQDNECYRIREGMTVCACFSSKVDDLRFFDATVDAVKYEDHLFKKNELLKKQEEECRCTFVLCWLHGPNKGNLSPTNVADICIVRSSDCHKSAITSFANLAKEKIKKAVVTFSSVSKFHRPGPKYPKEKRKLTSLQDGFQETKHAKQFLGAVWTKEESAGECGQHSDNDRDMGGVSKDMNSIKESGSHHYIIIDNLEKDLSAASIMEFIHKQTSILPQVWVVPSLPEEPYARAAILLDSEPKLKQIFDFLIARDHLIISSRGRPWFIPEKRPRRGTFRTLGSLMPKSQSEIIENELKVVRLGTEEYSRAVKVRNLLMEYLDHQLLLYNKLAAEEKKILLCPSLAL